MHQASAELKARTSAFIEADLAVVAQNAEKSYGVKNAAPKVSRFRQLLSKWEKLTPHKEDWDQNALAEIYFREIFSKLDPKTYGL